MKIYISGKITGMEAEAKVLFQQAEDKLTALGYEVVNPMKLPHEHDKRWISYMIECLIALKPCDGIYLIDNWNNSRGAIIEVREYIDNMDEKDKECLILTENSLP